jgi:hypothetical protein
MLINVDTNVLRMCLGDPAFKGAFIGAFVEAEVRVKAWNVQELSDIQFESSLSFSTTQGEFKKSTTCIIQSAVNSVIWSIQDMFIN